MKSIWIVDDDHSIRFVLERALAREQLPVRSFASASEVIGALDGDEPQVLVSDIRMPGGSGIDLLAKLKLRLPGLPVIVMTAYSDLDSAVGAFQAGAFEYLPKPFDLNELISVVNRALSAPAPSMPRAAAPPEEGERLYRHFSDELRKLGLQVQNGEFGADMDVSLINQGPVTIWLEV